MTATQPGSFACSLIQSKDFSVAFSLKPQPGSILSRHERSENAASHVFEIHSAAVRHRL